MAQAATNIDAELKKLIDESPSMQQQEKDGWLQMFDIMNDDQKAELKQILVTEKDKLADIDQKYKKKIGKIENKYFVKYVSVKAREERKEIREEEAQHREKTAGEAEKLLEDL